MRPSLMAATIPALLLSCAPLGAADNTIVDDSAPSGSPTASPPAPYSDGQFLYQHFVPKTGDPNQNSLYYRLYTPPSYATSGTLKHPLVFFLHGDGEKESGTIRNQLQMRDNGQYAFCGSASQAILPCFYALVQTSWYGRDGGAQTAADLTAALCARYRIDPDRVFVTGLSGGGGATLSWAGKQPQVWAGFIPLSAPTPGDVGSYQPGNLATIPSWFFAAKDDGVVGPGNQDGQLKDLRQRGARPIYTLYNNGGHSRSTWGSAYGTRALVQWMANLRRGQTVAQPVEVAITAPSAATTWTTAATTTNLAGTASDNQLGGGGSGVTAITCVNANGNAASIGGTLTAWTATGLPLPGGDTWAMATATGSSFDANRGGTTTYCDVMLVKRGAAANAAPVVNAGADFAITLPAGAGLSGSASDDGLPAGSTLAYAWSKVSGPGTVAFGSPASAATQASFGAPGTYVLRLSVSDGSLTANDDVTVTVGAAASNAAPVVNAGADLAVTLPGSASLAGSASDDGLPAGSTLTYAWTTVSGPGTVVFANAASAATTASFAAAGSYVLRLTASDGSLSASDDVAVAVAAAPAAGQVIRIDLGDAGATTTATGWNNICPPAALAVTGLVDASGAPTACSATAAGFAWSNAQGVSSSALYPASVQVDSLPVAAGSTATLTLGGLDPAATYDLDLFASRLYNSPSVAEYTVNGTTRSLDAYNNTANRASFTGLAASGGSLVVSVRAAAGSASAFLGAAVLTRRAVVAASRTVLIDLGSAAVTAGAWNNLTAPANGAIANAIDSNGAATGWSVAVSDAFAWSNDQGVAVDGAFPASAAKDSFYVDATGNGLGSITIAGLDAAKAYDVELFASRLYNSASNTAYDVNGTTVALNAYNNTATIATVANVRAGTGSITVQVRPASAADMGYLGVMRITEHAATATTALARITAAPVRATADAGSGDGGCGAGAAGILIAGLGLAGMGLGRRRQAKG